MATDQIQEDLYELLYSPDFLRIEKTSGDWPDQKDIAKYISYGWAYGGDAQFTLYRSGINNAKEAMRDKINEQIAMMRKFATENDIDGIDT